MYLTRNSFSNSCWLLSSRWFRWSWKSALSTGKLGVVLPLLGVGLTGCLGVWLRELGVEILLSFVPSSLSSFEGSGSKPGLVTLTGFFLGGSVAGREGGVSRGRDCRRTFTSSRYCRVHIYGIIVYVLLHIHIIPYSGFYSRSKKYTF